MVKSKSKPRFKAKPPGPDLLWKSIIEDLWEDFLRFFYPEYAPLVDFSRPAEFLDKELSNLSPPGRGRGRVADKLFKIWLLDGTEAWMLAHVEVQGKPQEDFAKRMGQMGYRIFDRHNVRPAALAILTDDDSDFHPRFFESTTWGQSLRYDFATYKVSDNPPEGYVDPSNPFALAMEATYFSLRKHKLDDQKRLEIKERLIQKLYAAGYSEKTIHHLFSFLKYIPRFDNSDFLPIFEAKSDAIKKIQPAMTTYELDLKYKFEQGIEKGVEYGIQRGIEIGIEQGIGQGEQGKEDRVILMLLSKGFSPKQLAEMLEIPLEKIEAIIKKHAADEAGTAT